MSRELPSQAEADARYEKKRVALCDAQGSIEERDRYKEACRACGITQRESLKIVADATELIDLKELIDFLKKNLTGE